MEALLKSILHNIGIVVVGVGKVSAFCEASSPIRVVPGPRR